ncbi:MAG: hypothetical protein EB152_05860, partial [Euryarchaeota archaeon]|nr:hypothetical protein [Euryarchaeota archaeon]
YVTGEHIPDAFQDAVKLLAKKIEGFKEGELGANDLGQALETGGGEPSLLEIIAYNLDESRYDHGFSSQDLEYFALVQVSDAEKSGAIYLNPEGKWLKPVFANSAEELSAALTDPVTGAAIDGIWDIGIYDPAASNPYQQNALPLGIQLDTAQFNTLMKGFVSISNYVDYWYAVNINDVIYELTGSGSTPLPDFATLDILNHDNFYINTESQSVLDSLETSKNNTDATLAVYGNPMATDLFWDFSGHIADGFNNIALFSGSSGVQDISDLNFASGQTLTLYGSVGPIPGDMWNGHGFRYSTFDRPLGVTGPSEIIIGDGTLLRVDADNTIHDVPTFINDGFGVLDYVGGDGDEVIHGTNG